MLTWVQLVIMAAIFTFSIRWLSRQGAPRPILIFSVVYYALNPVIALFTNCTSRDALFSAVAILVAMFSYDALADSEKQKSPKALLRLGFSCILLCLLRNNGIYAFAILAIVLCLLARSNLLDDKSVLGAPLVSVVFVLGQSSSESARKSHRYGPYDPQAA